ncbi:putative prenyltransferase contains1 4-dihydroxy-2-naphthoate octaprenyltransferase domain [Lactiplantibacillus plantarum]|nr:putative prenyltransferase contains1 4-dihydroxy-2-naphthoate octaprenyltransferase domain [Lactiplantibacillus plantarum]
MKLSIFLRITVLDGKNKKGDEDILSIQNFLELVEIRTKLASILPFFVGVLFSVAYFHQFELGNTLIFFVAMLIFDMTTTAINNLMDYKKAKSKNYKKETNLIGRENISPKLVSIIIITMLAISGLLGIWLVFRSGLALLYMGLLCFIIGIFYTFGPLPLSRLPLGEVFSGVTMGLGIPFIAIYLNVPNSLMDGKALLSILLICIVPIATIANIMLANNLSDYDQDIKNDRKTLPIVIGKGPGLNIYRILVLLGYLAVLLAVLLNLVDWKILVTLLTIPMAIKNTHIFLKKQDKKTTFPTAIKNLVIENVSLIISLIIISIVK